MPPPIALLLGLCALMLFASCDSSGGSSSDTTEETTLPVSTDLTLDGYSNWTTSTIYFTVDEDNTSVTVGVKGSLAYESYCDLDNITLYSTDDTTTNLLSNGDFETGDWSYEGWTVELPDSVSASDICSVTSDTTYNTNTSRFLKMSNWTSGKTAVSVSLTQTVELSAGNYTASIQVDGENKGSSTSALVFFAEIAEDDTEAEEE